MHIQKILVALFDISLILYNGLLEQLYFSKVLQKSKFNGMYVMCIKRFVRKRRKPSDTTYHREAQGSCWENCILVQHIWGAGYVNFSVMAKEDFSHLKDEGRNSIGWMIHTHMWNYSLLNLYSNTKFIGNTLTSRNNFLLFI